MDDSPLEYLANISCWHFFMCTSCAHSLSINTPYYFQDATAAAMEAAAAAEAAEAAVDSLGLDSVGVGVDVHATDGDDEMALAAAGE